MFFVELRSLKIVLITLLSACVSISSIAITDSDFKKLVKSLSTTPLESKFLRQADGAIGAAIRYAEYAVFNAMKANHSKEILELGRDRIVRAAVPYMHDNKGWTLLHCAVEVAAKKKWKNFETLDALRAIGANINQGDATEKSTTPMEAAKYFGAHEIAKYLRDLGADEGRPVKEKVVIKVDNGVPAANVGEEEEVRGPAPAASQARSNAGLIEERAAKRRKVNKPAKTEQNIESPAQEQPQVGFRPVYPVGDLLIGLSYEQMIINWIQARDWSAIFLAIATGSLSVDWRDSHGSTLMIYAAHQGNLEAIVDLIKVGGMPLLNAPNASGHTPMMYAFNNRDVAMINFLKAAEATCIQQMQQVHHIESAAQAMAGLLELHKQPQASQQDD